VPRWEWRTFGDSFGPADELLAPFASGEPHVSDEVYLLSTHSDASVKIRDGLMDVKRRDRVNDDGLELWKPVLKAGFPLAAEQVDFVMTALGVEPAHVGRDEYSLDQLVEDAVRPNAALRAVPVNKRRTRFVVDECMIEVTALASDDATTRTIAIESPDPALVSRTITRFALDGRRNVSVPSGLKALVGFGAPRHAVIDVGTNSVKFLLGERQADGGLRTIIDRADVTRLGEGLAASGELADAPMQRTADAVAAMADEARRNEALDISAVGTAGLRMAPNRDDFVRAVTDRCGVRVEIISGEEEGRLAHLAATSALPAAGGQLLVFDSGGGSSQFTFGPPDHVEERFSENVGAVRFAERFGLEAAVSREVVEAALDAVGADLGRLDGRPRPEAVLAIGGTATNLAAVKHGLAQYDAAVVHGTVLDVDEIDRQIELYRTRDAAERRAIVGLQPARAEVILAGACIVRTILAKLGHESLTVSDRGLRHGVFLERFPA
jgi:exopolyphosphatase/guanosine-5'-triphosphate,3'-diphosphate pyrophosphatase